MTEMSKREIYLEDLTVGETYTSPFYTVPREESVAFAMQYDPQPFHIDEEAAIAIYGGLTACSAYIFAIFCKVSNNLFGDSKVQAIAGLGFDELRMHKPLYVGDTVYVESEFTSIRRSKSKPDRGIVTSMNRMYNQHEEMVFIVGSTAMLRARTASDS